MGFYARSLALAFGSVFAMTTVRLALAPVLGLQGPVIFFFLAVIFSSFYGGAFAGTLATLLGVLSSTYFFMEPVHSFTVARLNDQWLVVIFIIEALMITTLTSAFRLKSELLVESEKDLRQAKDAAEAANLSKSQFLANMSHEIRTPMNAILGFADLLESPDLESTEKQDFVSRIRGNGAHLIKLIDDILDISKVEAGKLRIGKVKFSAPDIISEVIEAMKPLSDRKGLRLEVTFSSAIPQVICSDPVRFRQILMNILGNAIKFTEQGFVQIDLRFSSPGGEADRPQLEIEVRDSGIGIDPDAQQKLFKTFSQADDSVSRQFGGSGLGLVLSRRLAQALGGDLVLVRSERGFGSVFKITIDAGDIETLFITSLRGEPPAEAMPRKLNIAQRQKMLAGRRVLLAEDSPDGAALVKLYLQLEGVSEVDVVVNGFEAVERASQGRFDVILMDIQMPGMNGLEATRRLRRFGYSGPIIALTAHAMLDEVQRSLDAGCNLHVSKPVERGTLVEAIREVLGISRSVEVPAEL